VSLATYLIFRENDRVFSGSFFGSFVISATTYYPTVFFPKEIDRYKTLQSELVLDNEPEVFTITPKIEEERIAFFS
jgi:hypothetical protein